MFISVDVAQGALALREPEVFTQFHVSATGGNMADLVAALGAHGRSADDKHVYVAIESIRGWAEGSVGDSWEKGFTTMLAYAQDRGWLDEPRTHVRAHVEWADG